MKLKMAIPPAGKLDLSGVFLSNAATHRPPCFLPPEMMTIQPSPSASGESPPQAWQLQVLTLLLRLAQLSPPFQQLVLRPAEAPGQFDFAWQDAAGDRHAARVKSTLSLFSQPMTEKLAAQMVAAFQPEAGNPEEAGDPDASQEAAPSSLSGKASGSAASLKLVLIGMIHPRLEKITRIGSVDLQKRAYDLEELTAEAVEETGRVRQQLGLPAVPLTDQEKFVLALAGRLPEFCQEERIFTHAGWLELLREAMG